MCPLSPRSFTLPVAARFILQLAAGSHGLLAWIWVSLEIRVLLWVSQHMSSAVLPGEPTVDHNLDSCPSARRRTVDEFEAVEDGEFLSCAEIKQPKPCRGQVSHQSVQQARNFLSNVELLWGMVACSFGLRGFLAGRDTALCGQRSVRGLWRLTGDL